MIRQAHTYLAGAVSGTALVGAAIVAFVLLVSFQALRDWPLAGIGLGGDDAARSQDPAIDAGSGAPATGAAAAGAPTRATAGAGAADRRDRPNGGGNDAAPGTVPAPSATSPAESPASSPAGQSAPSASNPSGSSSSSQAGAGSGAGTSGSGGGAGSQTTSEAISGTVNDTVSGVDQATGGALGNTGAPKVTEEVVTGTVGPESVVGKTVDETVKTVGGVLGK